MLLSKHWMEKHVSWVKKYMKTDFVTVIFAYRYWATLNGADDWSRALVIHGNRSTSKTIIGWCSNTLVFLL